ncbi:MAG: DUF4263 domain-containing protein [Geobacteraceae bacterium]|nr:DUF4263 domain-containing protein [Geobacteraceae bacterium]
MPKKNILIVDDESDISFVLKLQLEDAGYSTTCANNGIAALEILKKEHFSLTLLDLKMPGMDGLQVLNQLKSSELNMPIIIMTAHGSEDIAVECMKSGASDYLSKPFSKDEMLKKIVLALKQKTKSALLCTHKAKALSKEPVVLIVEDEADVALILKFCLEDAGYRTERAKDGIKAIDAIGKVKFDLVLLDIKMPRMDGLQVLKRIGNSLRDVPVIMMTAHGNEDIVVECMKIGARDYISKPFSSDSLIGKINYLFEAQVENVEDNPEYIAVGVFEGEIRLLSLRPDGTYNFIDPIKKLHDILYVVDPETLEMEKAIEELEDLMNSCNAKESDYQKFFERYPDAILSSDYKKAHPQVVLAKEDGTSLIPDFVLEPVHDNKLCDILDIKLPTVPIQVGKDNRKRHSSAVFEACAQLREYNTYFDEEINRNRVFTNYGLTGYKPRMFVIIGRRSKLDPLETRRIELDTPQLHLSTYDEIIDRMKYRVQKMKIGIGGRV